MVTLFLIALILAIFLIEWRRSRRQAQGEADAAAQVKIAASAVAKQYRDRHGRDHDSLSPFVR